MYPSNGFSRQGWAILAEAEDALLLSGLRSRQVQVLGHRGAPAPAIPENSVAAVTRALHQGADGVEVDVWLAENGALLCAHDLAVADRSALATLADLLTAAQRPVGSQVVVEAKLVADAAVAVRTAHALADVLGTAGGTADVTVSSFDPGLLAMIRTTCADLPVRTALLGDSAAPAAAVVRRAHADGHDEVHLPLVALRRTPQVVETARWLGLGVAAWTVNRRRDLRWVAELGVDAVITDDVPGARLELNRAPVRERAGAGAVAAA